VTYVLHLKDLLTATGFLHSMQLACEPFKESRDRQGAVSDPHRRGTESRLRRKQTAGADVGPGSQRTAPGAGPGVHPNP
jgi:hypothetical protein